MPISRAWCSSMFGTLRRDTISKNAHRCDTGVIQRLKHQLRIRLEKGLRSEFSCLTLLGSCAMHLSASPNCCRMYSVKLSKKYSAAAINSWSKFLKAPHLDHPILELEPAYWFLQPVTAENGKWLRSQILSRIVEIDYKRARMSF